MLKLKLMESGELKATSEGLNSKPKFHSQSIISTKAKTARARRSLLFLVTSLALLTGLSEAQASLDFIHNRRVEASENGIDFVTGEEK